ncbi:MAG TPA: hypothetical protein PKI14_07680 [Fervidobacterium sp.]|nr:hypothetical protein [Fervidobacterium sp.]HOM74312.1 hypothetical protein [Fervidobacterium sp.]HOQ39891.1 hypothetical protein [Fervidobacterium sp.]HPP17999.1 hypothetical protein [Fervidobacterium sp.]HPT54711.1 hypothetical protein [Fervidobacterium sp.]
MWIFTLIGILVVALLLITFLPFLAPFAVWLIGILIFVVLLILCAVFLAALVPVIAIGFLIWIIYSAVKTWKKK